ncbi:MAG: TetR/AcrR family transcriptional regulator [Blastocatellia bacterium]
MTIKTAKKTRDGVEPRPSSRMAAEDRRQQILDVAVQLFSQKGFRGTTTKEIALAAGVNEAIIFRHFATKSDLYTAIMDRKACSADIQTMQNALKEAMEAGDDRQVFERLAFHMLEFHERDDTAMRLLLYSALEGHELADMIFRNHISKTHRQLAEYVKKRIAEGVFRRVDPMVAVRGFMGMIINQVMHKKFFEREGSQTVSLTNRQAAEKFTDLFLASMTNHDYNNQRARRKR